MKYNWSKVPSVQNLIIVLKTKIKFDNKELSNIFFDSLEDFFYHGTLLGYIKNYNFKGIVRRLLNIQRVGNLMKETNDMKSYSTSDKSGIYLANNLSMEESKYFMLKELIKISTSISLNVEKSITNDYLAKKNNNEDEDTLEDIYLEQGFNLIEEGIVLDMTENIYYACMAQKRPKRKNKLEKRVFGITKFFSNFKYHPSFQELTTIIGRGILKNSYSLSDDEVLKNLGRVSLKNNFSSNLFLSLKVLYGDNVYRILGKLGIIYKKEMDVHNLSIIKDNYLRVLHAKRAYKDIMKYLPQEKTIKKAC